MTYGSTFRFASLGSGSRGNATIVEVVEKIDNADGDVSDGGTPKRTRVMIDCGFGSRELKKRLARLDIEPETIDAVLITHEHSDHIGGVESGQRRYGWPVYLTAGSARKLKVLPTKTNGYHLIPAEHEFTVGDINIKAFPVPHDAREPCQYTVSHRHKKLGILSDLGRITEHVVDNLADCHALLLECNHDADMLMNGSYPAMLKRRVGGHYGHLSNAQSADLVQRLVERQAPLQLMALAHLSEQNNTPELALQAIRAVQPADAKVVLTTQTDGCAWLSVISQVSSHDTPRGTTEHQDSDAMLTTSTSSPLMDTAA